MAATAAKDNKFSKPKKEAPMPFGKNAKGEPTFDDSEVKVKKAPAADKPAANKTTPKKAAATKVAPAKKSAAKKEATPKAASDDKRKITLIEKTNPKREGTSSWDRYNLYKTCKTVGAFKEAGGTSADLRYDEAQGWIEVAE